MQRLRRTCPPPTCGGRAQRPSIKMYETGKVARCCTAAFLALPAAGCSLRACGARFARRALSRFRASLAALLSLLRPRFVCCYEYIGWKTEPAGRPLVPANACKFLANVANSWLQAACASQKREAQASGRGRHFSPFVSLTTTSSDVRSSRPFCLPPAPSLLLFMPCAPS